MGQVEACLLFVSWSIAFLSCYGMGGGIFPSILIAVFFAWACRHLWLKRVLKFDIYIFSALLYVVIILFFIIDPFMVGNNIMSFLHKIDDHFTDPTQKYIERKQGFQIKSWMYIGFISIAALGWTATKVIIGDSLRLRSSYGSIRILSADSARLAFIYIVYSSYVSFCASAGIVFYQSYNHHYLDYGSKDRIDFLSWCLIIELFLIALFTAYCAVLVFALFFIYCITIIKKVLRIRTPGTVVTRRSARIATQKAFAASVRLMDSIESNPRHPDLAGARQALETVVSPLRDAPGHDLLKSRLWETVGKIDLTLTDYASAKWHFDAALAAYDKVKDNDPIRRLALLENVGTLAVRLGDWGAASQTLLQVESAKRRALGPNHPDLAIALVALGNVRAKHGETAAGENNFLEALSIQRQNLSKGHIELVETLKNLGFLLLETGRFLGAVQFFEEALGIERKELGDYHPDTGLTLVGMGRAKDAAGDASAANSLLEEAFGIALLPQGIGLRDVTYQALSLREARQDRLGTAIFFGKEAVNAIQRQRTNLTTLAKDLQSAFLSTKEDIYRGLADLLVQAGRLSEAQRVLDLLKDDELSQFNLRHAPMDRTRALELTRSESKWKKHGDGIVGGLAALTQEYQELIGKFPRNPEDEGRIETIRQAFDASRFQMKAWLDGLVDEAWMGATEAQDDIRALNLDYLESLQSELADLGDDVVLLYFVVGATRLSIILTTPTLQISRDVDISRVELNRKIDDFLFEIRKRSVHTKNLILLARVLHEYLIAPIADYLTGEKVIMAVLDGALRYLPLPALHDGTDYLIARHAFALMTPAAHKPMTPDRDWTKKGVGGLGITRATNLDDLDAVDDELRGIVRQDGENAGIYPGRRYLDAAFTANTLADALATRSVVHIASHFSFNAATAASSRLMLGDGTELSLQDLDAGRYKFTGIDLVTLSACETALGTEAFGADRVASHTLDGLQRLNGREFESLGAMIQKRGARAVIATLWAVEDRSTALLMKQFYQGRRDGLTKAAALRQAQRRLLDDATDLAPHGHVSVTQSHPYFWAPFVLIGNWL